MLKAYGMQVISISCALALLSGCRWGNKQNGQASVSPLIQNPHVQPEYKMQRVAAQLDAITTQNVHDTLGGTNPSYLTNSNLFLQVEGFYWKAFEDNLEYGLETKLDSDRLNGHAKTVNFRWEPGVRLGIGYLLGFYDQWDLTAKWTYYHAEARGSETSHFIPQKRIYSSWMPQFLGSYADIASGHWQLNYNVWDFEVGRNYFISRDIAIRPFACMRVASIHQNYRAKYNALFETSGVAVGFPTRMIAENNFLGGGPRFGMDMMWHFARHWGVFGQFSGSLLYAEFDVEQKFKGRQPGAPSNPFEFKLDRDINRVRPNLETAIGVQFETPILRQGRNHISISLVYELSYWFQQNQLAKLPVTSFLVAPNPNNAFDYEVPGGDLNMHGGTLKFQYNF